MNDEASSQVSVQTEREWKLESLEIGFTTPPLITNINCSIQMGDMVAITGANGCGKSCLLKTLAGINPAISGFIHSPSDFSYNQLGVVPQVTEIFPRFRISLQEMVELGVANTNEKKQQSHIKDAMDAVGLNNKLAKQAWQRSSGGERQRTLIARALVREPQVVLLDEATSHIDQDGTKLLMEYLRALCDNKKLVVLAVNHDAEINDKYFPKHIHISNRSIELSGW